jgi:hypothetical protein
VVEHPTYYPKIEGSNPATNTEKEKKGKKNKFESKWLLAVALLAEQVSFNFKIEGSNHTTGTEREKKANL